MTEDRHHNSSDRGLGKCDNGTVVECRSDGLVPQRGIGKAGKAFKIVTCRSCELSISKNGGDRRRRCNITQMGKEEGEETHHSTTPRRYHTHVGHSL